MTKPVFRLEVSFDDSTGAPVAVYLRVRDGDVAETKEVKEGIVYADYDPDGSLLGVELLGTCEPEILESLGANEPEAVQRFLRGSPPRNLISA
jgi:hypothetical protein